MGNNKNCPYPTFFIKLGVRKSKVLQYRGDKEKNTFSIDIFACFNVSDDVEKCKILNDKIQKLAMEFNKFRKYNDIQSCDKHRNYFAIINLLQYENNLNIDQHTYATFEIGDIRIFKKNTFFPLKELEFEGKKHPVPGNIEDYLVNLYGKD
jgi:phosphorylcholine metabolism protein LicD